VLGSDTCCEGDTVTRTKRLAGASNESIGEIQSSAYAPTICEFSDGLGGGAEYFPSWRQRLWPFTLFRSFEQEDQ
jgi:hypothetical protein